MQPTQIASQSLFWFSQLNQSEFILSVKYFNILLSNMATRNSSIFANDQIKCKIHPDECITNFCWQDNCLAELCASCICQHTEMHNRKKSKPHYENIKQTYANIHESLGKLKESLGKQKARVKTLVEGIEKRRKEVQKLFKQAREDVLALVDKTFLGLEKQYGEQLERERSKSGLLDTTRLDCIYAQINKSSLDIYTITQQLTNSKSAETIKKVVKQFMPKSASFKNAISLEISNNQLFQPCVSYKPVNLEGVEGALKRLITLSFSYPIQGGTEKGNGSRTPSKNSQRVNLVVAANLNSGPSHNLQARSPNKQHMGKENGMKIEKTEPIVKMFSNTFSY